MISGAITLIPVATKRNVASFDVVRETTSTEDSLLNSGQSCEFEPENVFIEEQHYDILGSI